MTIANILLILVLVALNGFLLQWICHCIFARSRLELIGETRGRSYEIVHDWLENFPSRDRLIASTQLGITLVSLALGAVGQNTFKAWLEPYLANVLLPDWLAFLQFLLPAVPLTLSLIIITAIHVVVGEQVPKVTVLRKPEQFALFAAPIINIFFLVSRLYQLFRLATRLILGLLGLPPDTNMPLYIHWKKSGNCLGAGSGRDHGNA